MILSRGVVRLSAPHHHQGWNSSLLLSQFKPVRLDIITCSLRKRHTAQCSDVCGYGPSTSTLSPGDNKLEQPGNVFTGRSCWDSSRFIIISHREHFSLVKHTTALNALNLSTSHHSSDIGGQGNNHRKLHTLHYLSGRKTQHLHAPLFTHAPLLAPLIYTPVQMRPLSTVGVGKEAAEHGGDKEPHPEAPKPEPEEAKPSKAQQLKKVFKEYGAVGVAFHTCISLMSLGMFYLAVSSGIDMVGLLGKLGFSESVVQSRMAAGTSTFVLAYAVHKLFAPVRMSMTLVSVPLIVRYFRKTGLFKPPASPP